MASDAITAFCASSDYLGLAQYCENFELDLRHTEVDLATSVGIYKVHLVAYLLLSDLDRARFLWKRLPEEVKADTELQALWAVGKAMWQHQHSGVQAAASAYAWSTPFVAPLMNTLQTQYLERIFGQMSNAYATVTAETLATKLGAHAVIPSALPALVACFRGGAITTTPLPTTCRRADCEDPRARERRWLDGRRGLWGLQASASGEREPAHGQARAAAAAHVVRLAPRAGDPAVGRGVQAACVAPLGPSCPMIQSERRVRARARCTGYGDPSPLLDRAPGGPSSL